MRSGRLTTRDIAQARAMAEEGRSVGFIACQIGCTDSTAWRHVGDILRRHADTRRARLLEAWTHAGKGNRADLPSRFGHKNKASTKRVAARIRSRQRRLLEAETNSV